MRYTFQKIGLVIGVLFFWTVFTGVLMVVVLNDLQGGKVLIAPSVTATLALLVLITSWRRITRYQTQTYDWYIQAHPNAYKNSRVFCNYCNSGKIHTKNLFNRTFTREHFCGQCGKTLYYSPESS